MLEPSVWTSAPGLATAATMAVAVAFGDVVDRGGSDLSAGLVLEAHHRGLASRAGTDVEFLVGVLVGFLTADVGLVDFDGAVKAGQGAVC